MSAGRPRKIKSKKALEEAWEEYKNYCDNQMVLTHEFSNKSSQFVSKELRRKITYTITGFCVYVGLTRSAFYDTYRDDPKYSDVVARMRLECEVDARTKFETGDIPSNLAALWMSKYGYTTKQDNNTKVDLPVFYDGEDDLDE